MVLKKHVWESLDTFSLDDLPMFTRTVLTSSPVLVLPGREGAPTGSLLRAVATHVVSSSHPRRAPHHTKFGGGEMQHEQVCDEGSDQAIEQL